MIIKGIAAASGIALAKCLIIKEKLLEDCTEERIVENNKAEEIKKFIHNRDCVLKELESINHCDHSKIRSDIIAVHRMLLTDQMLVDTVTEKIEKENYSALGAIQKTINEQAAIFEALEDNYFRERALDIRDVGQQLEYQILGIKKTDLSNLKEDVILAARDIMPSQMAVSDVSRVKGIITEAGGTTSHTAIIAKNMGIPAVLGIVNVTSLLEDGAFVAVNGFNGTVETELTDTRVEEINYTIEKNNTAKLMLKSLVGNPSKTKDGTNIKLFSNILNASDADKALEVDADGIGLYRTEFLFMDRKNTPTEEEQYQAYKGVLMKMGEKPVAIRTLDIGGDKEIGYLNLPKEANPFLGYRAIRICLNDKQLFKTQLRAILRASASGNVQIMYPMISSLEEVRKANAILEEAKSELINEGYELDKNIPVGIMIEIPSAAVIADILIKEVDFFSIGTNDLTQYMIAVDRMNEKINKLYNYYHPGVLRIIAQIIQAADKAGEDKFVCMCGEMAGDPVATLLLLGMGLKKFSINPAALLEIKKIITSIEMPYAYNIATEALKMSTAEEIEKYLRNKYDEMN